MNYSTEKNYKEFLQCVKDCVTKNAEEGSKILINHIIKNNGKELDGLVILKKGCNVAPTIYLNDYYGRYKCGVSVDDIVADIMRFYENNNNFNFNPEIFEKYANIKGSIVYKVINYDKNRKLLEDIPHKKLLDLAVVFYCLIERSDGISATALIHNSHVKSWGITEDQLYEDAIVNTPNLLESCIKPISMLLKEIVGTGSRSDDRAFNSYDEKELELMCTTNEMFVLTNKSRINGAACILYEKVLERLAETMDSDLYILPSSVHEVILLPKHSSYDKNMLKEMVCEVNAEGVAADEILSDNVYVYNRKDGTITM